MYRVPESEWLEVLSVNLSGGASRWMNLMQMRIANGSRNPFTGWRQWSQEIKTKFEATTVEEKARVELRRLKQMGSLHEYVKRFHNIVFRIPAISQAEMFSAFTYGLKAYLRTPIVAQITGNNVDAAIAMAERLAGVQAMGPQEESEDLPTERRRRRWKNWSRKPKEDKSSGRTHEAVPQINAVSTTTRRSTNRSMDKVKCYKCGQYGHIRAHCKTKIRPSQNSGN